MSSERNVALVSGTDPDINGGERVRHNKFQPLPEASFSISYLIEKNRLSALYVLSLSTLYHCNPIR